MEGGWVRWQRKLARIVAIPIDLSSLPLYNYDKADLAGRRISLLLLLEQSVKENLEGAAGGIPIQKGKLCSCRYIQHVHRATCVAGEPKDRNFPEGHEIYDPDEIRRTGLPIPT